jgi:hypothetical protein
MKAVRHKLKPGLLYASQAWSFYIFSSGSGLNQPWIGGFEPERSNELALLSHFFAK